MLKSVHSAVKRFGIVYSWRAGAERHARSRGKRSRFWFSRPANNLAGSRPRAERRGSLTELTPEMDSRFEKNPLSIGFYRFPSIQIVVTKTLAER